MAVPAVAALAVLLAVLRIAEVRAAGAPHQPFGLRPLRGSFFPRGPAREDLSPDGNGTALPAGSAARGLRRRALGTNLTAFARAGASPVASGSVRTVPTSLKRRRRILEGDWFTAVTTG